MTQKKIRGDQLDLTIADGSLLAGVDADLLNGQAGAFYQNANNLNAGTLAPSRLSGTYGINISGNAATASDSNALGGSAAATYAKLASPAFTGNPTAPTPLPGDNDTSIATTAFVQAAAASSGIASDTSSALSIANVVTWPHSLGVEPDDVSIVFQNVTSEAGWPVGSRILVSVGQYARQTQGDNNEVFNVIAEVSPSIVRLNFGPRFILPNYLVGGNSIIFLTRSNWVLYITAFKY